MDQQKIAKAFSAGNFETAYPFLSADTTWEVIGDFKLKGKEAIAQKCEQTASYFRSVTTNFKTENVIVDKDRIAINGTAEFIREGKRVAFVEACDVYQFENGMIKNITSYCIQDKK